MSDVGRLWLDAHRARLANLAERAARAIERMSEDDLYWRPNEESNSVANLVLHLVGNVSERLLGAIGGQPYARDRDAEFNSRERLPRAELLTRFRETLAAADRVLAELDPARLTETWRLPEREVTLAELIVIVVTHFAEHTGQILYVGKARLGAAWEPLSTPHRRA